MKLPEDKLKKIGDKATNYLFPFLTTITGVIKDNSVAPKYIGTGVYIKYNGYIYIASARHVADNLTKFSYLFYGAGNKGYPIQGHWVSTTVADADFGVMGCFEESLTIQEKVLNYDDAIFSSNHSQDAYYLITGFPGKLHTQLDFINTHQHGGNSVISILKSIDENIDGDEILFQLEYSKNLTPPPGMSGSPVWNLNLHLEENIKNWDVSKITFAGIVTRWDESNQTILATNSELIKQVLPAVTNKFRELYPRTDK